MAPVSPKAVKAVSGWLAKSRQTHTGSTNSGAQVKPKIAPTNFGKTSGGGSAPKAKGNSVVNAAKGIMKSVPGSKGK